MAEGGKITVGSGGVSVFAYGTGAHVTAGYVTVTEEAGRELKKAIEGLVELHLLLPEKPCPERE